MQACFNNRILHYELDNRNMAWFIASEVAAHLGYNTYHMLRMVKNPEDRATLIITNPKIINIGLDMTACLMEIGLIGHYICGGTRRFAVINERGLYIIAKQAKAKRPEVKDFANWVLDELLMDASYKNINNRSFFNSVKVRRLD